MFWFGLYWPSKMNSQQLFPFDFPIGKSIIRHYIDFSDIDFVAILRKELWPQLQNKSFLLPRNSILEDYKYKSRTRLNIECK